MTTMGTSHNFFLARRNAQSSSKIAINFLLSQIKIDFAANPAQARAEYGESNTIRPGEASGAIGHCQICASEKLSAQRAGKT
jgi:hypothetical protein